MNSKSYEGFRFNIKFHIVCSIFLIVLPSIIPVFSAVPPEGSFNYQFIVSDDGSTLVRIIYSSDVDHGSSWVLVPKFSKWVNYTVSGRVYKWNLDEPEKYTGVPYYFYEVLNFLFTSEEQHFEMVIEFNFSTAAMIIEPDGIFYSPQIGFKLGSRFEASVRFPPTFKVNLNEALALGNSGSYKPDRSSNSSYILFRDLPPTENLLRIEIGFKVPRKADYILLESGIFKFNTVKRYESYAWKILNLYNATYETLVNLFNTTLDQSGSSSNANNVTVRFFIPDFHSLMSVGGYVPFSGERLGDIHINFVFTRYVEGYLEVVALHELIHHFLWRAGISPRNLLWFHEGMAQYVSVEIAESLGYEGAGMIKRDLENRTSFLEAITGRDLSFLVYWSPSNTPRNLDTLYTAAYYVVSRLAEKHGGLNYYARFFKLLNNKIEDNAMLCYYLSLAANKSIADELNALGFNIPDLYTYAPLFREIESAIEGINSSNLLLQPFKLFIRLIYKSIVLNAGRISAEKMQLYLLIVLTMARLAPLLALILYSGIIFVVMIFILRLKKVF